MALGDAMDDAPVDATRRTRLANERTYLAWWRSGLTCLAVALAAGAVVPDLTDGRRWPWVALGIAFAVLGVAFMAYGVIRHRQIEAAIDRGGYAPLNNGIATAFGAAGVVIALVTIVVIALET